MAKSFFSKLQILFFTFIVNSLFFLHSVWAADKELLDILLANGAITPSQYQQLIKKSALTKNDVKDIVLKLDKKGLQVATKDKTFKFKISGRLQVDGNWNLDDDLTQNGQPVQTKNGVDIRRGRIDFKGVLWRDWNFDSEIDFAKSNATIKDMFLSYTGFENIRLNIGNQKVPISMELQESSNDILFTERSLVVSLTGPLFDRAIGFLSKAYADNWSAQLGFYGDSIKSVTNDDSGNQGWALASRLTYAPLMQYDRLIHLGAYGGYRAKNGIGEFNDAPLRFRYQTTNISNIYLTDTDVINNADYAAMVGAEIAGLWGPLSMQFEYVHTWVGREADSTLAFNAWYVLAAWNITGESRSYKGADGEFKRLVPKQNFSLKNGGWGAFELALRIDGNDLNSKDITGGEEVAFTIALNWYVNYNIRFMADYRRSLYVEQSPLSRPDGSAPDGVGAFTFRTQWAY